MEHLIAPVRAEDDQSRRAGRGRKQLAQELQREIVGPVQVVEHEQQRPLGGQVADAFGEHREQSFERTFGRQVARDGVAIDAGQVGQARLERREHERAVAQQPAGRRFAALDAVIGHALEEAAGTDAAAPRRPRCRPASKTARTHRLRPESPGRRRSGWRPWPATSCRRRSRRRS